MFEILILLVHSIFYTNGIPLNSSKVCVTEVCFNESNKMISYMDEGVDPCDDFYEFACGKFRKNAVLSVDKYSQSAFTLAQDKITEQMRTILTEKRQSNESKSIKLAKEFTKMCTDDVKLNKMGRS